MHLESNIVITVKLAHLRYLSIIV